MCAAVPVLLLTACGGGDQPDDRAAAEEAAAAEDERVVACELVPPADVTDILGMAVERTDPTEVDSSDGTTTRYMTGCTYIAENDATMRTATITLTRGPEITDPAAALQRFVEGMRGEYAPYQLASVPELGPGAGWDDESEQLVAFRPGWQLVVMVDRQGALPGLEGARTLAGRVFERLP